MSFQAVTWAIEQRAGSPSAKAVLWSIANYANDQWCAWPKQDTIARDSEQSTDSVGKRVVDIVELGLARRIKLKRHGRRTHDFLILKPSPHFNSPLEDILSLIPSGCDVMSDAAADCGSAESGEAPKSQEESEINAAAESGSVSEPTLPQSAVDATALERQQEPVINQESPPKSPPPGGNELETWLKEFRESYPLPCNNPAALAVDAEKLTADQRQQALIGAKGTAAFHRLHPKRHLVGPNRFIRSSALWAEYSKFTPTSTAAKTPRVFVPEGSAEWKARSVLAAIVGDKMPEVKFDEAQGTAGADFLGSLPPAGLALARFDLDTSQWPIIDKDKPEDRPRIAAWRERIFECIGVSIEPAMIFLEGFSTHKDGQGKEFQARRRVVGLKVPSLWPPRKDGSVSTGPPGEISDEDAEEFLKRA